MLSLFSSVLEVHTFKLLLEMSIIRYRHRNNPVCIVWNVSHLKQLELIVFVIILVVIIIVRINTASIYLDRRIKLPLHRIPRHVHFAQIIVSKRREILKMVLLGKDRALTSVSFQECKFQGVLVSRCLIIHQQHIRMRCHTIVWHWW